jgi:hypothetical protein
VETRNETTNLLLIVVMLLLTSSPSDIYDFAMMNIERMMVDHIIMMMDGLRFLWRRTEINPSFYEGFVGIVWGNKPDFVPFPKQLKT